MKLVSFHVTEFQSVRNSNPIKVDDITCLVGKNEAGKTAIMQALYRLNPVLAQDTKFDVTDDYPRSEVKVYQDAVRSQKREPATVVKGEFELEKADVAEIEKEFGGKVLNGRILTLSKGYSDVLMIGLQVNEAAAVKSLIKEAQLPIELANALSSAITISELDAAAASDTTPENVEHLKRLKAVAKRILDAKGLTLYIYNTYLTDRVPLFAYFDEFFLMKGIENINRLIARRDQNKLDKSDYPLLGFVELASLKIDDLLNPSRTQELKNALEGAGNHLSRRVLKYWSQNKRLKMHIDVRPALAKDPEGMTNGMNIIAEVEDQKREATTHMGTRSRGFAWFFSFLSWFDQQSRDHKNLILLLDEPGLFLHGRAQGDLLRFIEVELKPSLQVLYTTHSPFMVDPTKFERVRIVQDKGIDTDKDLPRDEDGTKVITDVLEANDDSLFPLQGALGYDLCQTLFVGPYSLVVEGVSDLLYLQTMSAFLESSSKRGLDPRWTITPVGGIDKVPTFVALLGAQRGLTIATLVDFQKKDQQTIENLYRSKLLKKEKVFTFAEFVGGGRQTDIEDMFDVDFFLSLVNGAYASSLPNLIAAADLGYGSPRILRRLEARFAAYPLKNGVKFNHYHPAWYLSTNIGTLANSISAATANRFEALFAALNSML